MKKTLLLLPLMALLTACGGNSESLSRITRSSHDDTSSFSSTSNTGQSSSHSSSAKDSEESSLEQSESISLAPSDSQSIISNENEETSNPIEESSTESETSSSQTQKPITIEDIDSSDSSAFFDHYYRKLASYGSYKSVTEGKTVANVLFINTEQTIECDVIKGNEYSYMRNGSKGSFVSSEHIAYYHDKETLSKNEGDSDFKKASLDDYLDEYGTYPFDWAVEGFDTSKESVLTFSLAKDGDHYKASFSLDPQKSTNNVRIQMKKFGSLDDYPSFTAISMELHIKDDFTPIKLDLTGDYSAKKVVDSACHQTYTVTYSNFDESIDIPNLSDIIGKF